MLSIGKLTQGRAEYYIEQVQAGKDEYYTGREEPGHWTGNASHLLGLGGEVGPKDFRSVLSGCHPASGEPLSPGTDPARRVAGFDLCFSAPKSVSLAWALAPPELADRIVEAHDEAVRQSLQAIEDEVLRARRGAGGHISVETEGLVAAAFPHRTSRAGDPQVHTHVVAANLTPDESGRWSAPDGARFYRWAKTVGYLYQSALRQGMAELGFEWGPVRNGHADLVGFAPEAINAFSARRAAIEAELGERGLSSGRAAQAATLATRAAKESVPHLGQLRQEWAAKAQGLGLSTEHVASLAQNRPGPWPDLDELNEELLSPSGLTVNSSTFDRRSVIQALAHEHDQGADVRYLLQAADRLVGRAEVVPLDVVGRREQRYSTTELLATEQDLVQQAVSARGQGLGVAPAPALQQALDARPSLSDEQRAMVSALTTSGDGVQVVVGRAGTGKTFALDAARSAWEASGHRVIGTALAARAAAELQSGAGIPSSTLDRLLLDLDQDGPLAGFAPGTVVVVDEAGMVGTRKLARLLDHASHWQAGVVLVGDPRQLPEVEAGGAFSALATALPVVELSTNRRQHEPWEREALAELRAGSVERAVGAFEANGRVTLASTAVDARTAMVQSWWAARQAGEKAMMYALRRSDVDDLNQRARTVLRHAGLLGEEAVQAGGREYAIGEQVMCLRNDRRLDLRNGDIATVVTAGPGGLGLSDGREVPTSYIENGNLTYAYASTVHKAQGATVDRAFLLGSDQLYREAGYVGLSRGRLSNELFVVGGDLDRDVGHIVDSLQESRAQSLASSYLSDASPVAGAARPPAAALLANPPQWALEALGQPPVSGLDRRRWAEHAAQLAVVHSPPGQSLTERARASTEREKAQELARLLHLEPERQLENERGIGL